MPRKKKGRKSGVDWGVAIENTIHVVNWAIRIGKEAAQIKQSFDKANRSMDEENPSTWPLIRVLPDPRTPPRRNQP